MAWHCGRRPKPISVPRSPEALAQAGVAGLLVTSPVVGADKVARLARLNRADRGAGITVVVDHPAQLEALADALASGDPPLGVLVDVDVG
jgi:3-hydroxy-D-aspartate aldolase